MNKFFAVPMFLLACVFGRTEANTTTSQFNDPLESCDAHPRYAACSHNAVAPPGNVHSYQSTWQSYPSQGKAVYVSTAVINGRTDNHGNPGDPGDSWVAFEFPGKLKLKNALWSKAIVGTAPMVWGDHGYYCSADYSRYYDKKHKRLQRDARLTTPDILPNTLVTSDQQYPGAMPYMLVHPNSTPKNGFEITVWSWDSGYMCAAIWVTMKS